MKFPCVLMSVLLAIRESSGLSFSTKRIGLPCSPLLLLLLVAFWDYLVENHLLFPSAPRWVLHSYLSKGIRLIPYTWVISELSWIFYLCDTVGLSSLTHIAHTEVQLNPAHSSSVPPKRTNSDHPMWFVYTLLNSESPIRTTRCHRGQIVYSL